MTADSVSKTPQPANGRKLTYVLVAAIVLAHVPMLVEYFRRLWLYDHYQFFPFALLACAYFMWKRINWGAVAWTKLPVSLLVVDIALLTGSCLLNSPWLAAVGFFLAIVAICFAAAEKEEGRRPIGLPLLYLTVVRPPFGYDVQLIQDLQTLTTSLSCNVLDRIGVLHVRSGNLIELTTKPLFIEEACSGVQSLFTLIFLAVLICVWRKRSPMHLLCMLPLAPVCAIPMNVLRVIAIALGWEYFKVDLAIGWQHDATGYTLLALGTLLLLSADWLVCFVGGPMFMSWAEERDRRSDNPLVAHWNRLWGHPWAPRGQRSTQSVVLASLAVVLSLGLISAQCYALYETGGSTKIVAPTAPEAADSPQTLGNFTLSGTDTQSRSISSSLGQYSSVWTYAAGANQMTFSCDYPFQGWHHVEQCYEGQGWKVTDREVIEDETWPALAFNLSKPTGERAYLVYSFFNTAGEPVRPPRLDDPTAAVVARMFKPGNWVGGNWVTYQSQLFYRYQLKLSPSRKAELNGHHRTMRQLMMKSVTEATDAKK